MNSPQRKITGPRPMGSRSPSGQQGLQHSDTVIRRKPIAGEYYPRQALQVKKEHADNHGRR